MKKQDQVKEDFGTDMLKKLLEYVKNMSPEEYDALKERSDKEFKPFFDSIPEDY